MNHDPLRVYVAGASVERAERAIPTIASLRAEGITITHDWTCDMFEGASADKSEADVPDDVRRRYSELDANGVRLADFVLLLAPNERGSSGAWVELGMALAHRVPVVVSGPKNRRTIFTSMAHRLFNDDQDAIFYLASLQRARG